jgi:hypothetical protein
MSLSVGPFSGLAYSFKSELVALIGHALPRAFFNFWEFD